jgi:integron integrase
MDHKPKLLDLVRNTIRLKHYSIRTERAYIDWIRRFILFHHKRHPASMGAPEISAFLSHLAVEGKVAASTQTQALSAIVFLYREVLKRHVGSLGAVARAKRHERLPVVFSRAEVRGVLAHLDGAHRLMASFLYGAGLRLMECIRLRVKDVDFAYRQILVRDGKGQKDRVTMLPQALVEPLKHQLEKAKVLHEQDLTEGFGQVYLPFALDRKRAQASREWGWQYVFPARRRSIDPRSGKERRHHTDETALQEAVKKAVRAANILQARKLSYLSPQLRHPPARGRL